jgi:hypothetical protein
VCPVHNQDRLRDVKYVALDWVHSGFHVILFSLWAFFFFCLVSLIFSKLESVSKLAYKVFHLEIPEGDCILHCDY